LCGDTDDSSPAGALVATAGVTEPPWKAPQRSATGSCCSGERPGGASLLMARLAVIPSCVDTSAMGVLQRVLITMTGALVFDLLLFAVIDDKLHRVIVALIAGAIDASAI
jgi:hypothetical protein